MSQMTTAIFDSRDDARRAVHALRDHGVPEGAVSILAGEEPGRGVGLNTPPEDVRGLPSAGKDEGISTTTPGDAGKGAVEGAALGAGLGLVAAIASIAIPGFGLVAAGGALATALAGAAATTAGGALAGGVVGFLTDMGVPDQAAHHYAEGIRSGGVLVSVLDTDEATPDEVLQILAKYNGRDPGTYAGDGRMTTGDAAGVV